MTNPRRDRERKQARRPAFCDPRPVIAIVCEGENTEPQYFNDLWQAARNPRVRVFFHPEHGVPKTLVEMAKQVKKNAQIEARRQNDENLAFDSIWCVFDIDEHPNVPEARLMASDSGESRGSYFLGVPIRSPRPAC